jgi:hypothetical protein
MLFIFKSYLNTVSIHCLHESCVRSSGIVVMNCIITKHFCFVICPGKTIIKQKDQKDEVKQVAHINCMNKYSKFADPFSEKGRHFLADHNMMI